MEKKTVAIYARVSTSHQEEQQTIQSQIIQLKKYAESNELVIVKEYLDDGWSGDSLVRPALDQMRVEAKSNLWKGILIYDPDRLARRYSYQELIMDELKETGKQIYFVTTPPPKDGIEKILFGVQGIFAEYERAKITERFRVGKLRKATEGNVIAVEAPYGYTFVPKKGKRGDVGYIESHYEVNPTEAQVVRLMFSWLANENISLRGIVRRLKELNIKPRKSKRGIWHSSTLSRLFRNKTYIGEAHFGASYATVPLNPVKIKGYRKNKKTSRRLKHESEWIKIKVEAIIDSSIFRQVQEKLKANIIHSRRNTRSEYLLSGKMFCSCEKRMAGQAPNPKRRYYKCTSVVQDFLMAKTCNSRYLNAIEADKSVWEYISNLMTDPQLLFQQIERVHNAGLKDANQKSGVEDLIIELKKISKQIERYTEAYANEIITSQQFTKFTEPLKAKMAFLNGQVNSLNNQNVEEDILRIPKKEEIIAFVQEAKTVLQTLDFTSRKDMIRQVIEKITVKENHLSVTGHIPIGVFSGNRISSNTIDYDDEKPSALRLNYMHHDRTKQSALCLNNPHHDSTIIASNSLINSQIPIQFEIDLSKMK